MPVVKVRAPKRPAKGDSLVRKVTETTSDLLTQNDRVLVVYGKETASIYYEGSELPPSLPRAS
jgi:phenylpyruvate tautomerase PptA (4-oxalocrotonate tautomerase family)